MLLECGWVACSKVLELWLRKQNRPSVSCCGVGHRESWKWAIEEERRRRVADELEDERRATRSLIYTGAKLWTTLYTRRRIYVGELEANWRWRTMGVMCFDFWVLLVTNLAAEFVILCRGAMFGREESLGHLPITHCSSSDEKKQKHVHGNLQQQKTNLLPVTAFHVRQGSGGKQLLWMPVEIAGDCNFKKLFICSDLLLFCQCPWCLVDDLLMSTHGNFSCPQFCCEVSASK